MRVGFFFPSKTSVLEVHFLHTPKALTCPQWKFGEIRTFSSLAELIMRLPGQLGVCVFTHHTNTRRPPSALPFDCGKSDLELQTASCVYFITAGLNGTIVVRRKLCPPLRAPLRIKGNNILNRKQGDVGKVTTKCIWEVNKGPLQRLFYNPSAIVKSLAGR